MGSRIIRCVLPREFGYRHTGELRYIDVSGDIHEDIAFWQRFRDRAAGRVEDFLDPGTDGLKDHSMRGYVSLIEKAVTSGG